jgi:hypothetical protein
MNDSSVKRIAELITGGEAATTKMWLQVGAIINAEVPDVKPTELVRFNGTLPPKLIDFRAIGAACELVRKELLRKYKMTTCKSALYSAARAARVLTPEQQSIIIKSAVPMRDVARICTDKREKQRDATIAGIAKNGRTVNMSRSLEYAGRKKGPKSIHTASTQGAGGLCNVVLYGDEGDEACQNAMDSLVMAMWQMKRDPEGKFQKALARVRRTT